jgi:hypothetical protein
MLLAPFRSHLSFFRLLILCNTAKNQCQGAGREFTKKCLSISEGSTPEGVDLGECAFVLMKNITAAVDEPFRVIAEE